MKDLGERCECDAYVEGTYPGLAKNSSCDVFLDLNGWNHAGPEQDSCAKCGEDLDEPCECGGPPWLQKLADADLCRASQFALVTAYVLAFGSVVLLVAILTLSGTEDKSQQRRGFKLSGVALAAAGAAATFANAYYVAAYETIDADVVACGRGCFDAYAGGIMALVGGVAMVASQGFYYEVGDCLLALGYLALQMFILLTGVKWLWDYVTGGFGD